MSSDQTGVDDRVIAIRYLRSEQGKRELAAALHALWPSSRHKLEPEGCETCYRSVHAIAEALGDR